MKKLFIFVTMITLVSSSLWAQAKKDAPAKDAPAKKEAPAKDTPAKKEATKK